MMVKVVTIFYQAEDPSILDDYYYNHYLPHILKVPGVIKVESTRFYSDLKKVLTKKKDVTPIYQIMSELYFEDLEAFEKGFTTPEMEYIANNLIEVAWDLISGYMGDVSTITPEEFEKDPTFIRRINKN